MDELTKQMEKLSEKEKDFLNENISLTICYYWQVVSLTEIVREKIIYCDNSYERRIVHILAHLMGYHHVRYGEWDENFEEYFDFQCKCKYCWKNAGEKCRRKML